LPILSPLRNANETSCNSIKSQCKLLQLCLLPTKQTLRGKRETASVSLGKKFRYRQPDRRRGGCRWRTVNNNNNNNNFIIIYAIAVTGFAFHRLPGYRARGGRLEEHQPVRRPVSDLSLREIRGRTGAHLFEKGVPCAPVSVQQHADTAGRMLPQMRG